MFKTSNFSTLYKQRQCVCHDKGTAADENEIVFIGVFFCGRNGQGDGVVGGAVQPESGRLLRQHFFIQRAFYRCFGEIIEGIFRQ